MSSARTRLFPHVLSLLIGAAGLASSVPPAAVAQPAPAKESEQRPQQKPKAAPQAPAARPAPPPPPPRPVAQPPRPMPPAAQPSRPPPPPAAVQRPAPQRPAVITAPPPKSPPPVAGPQRQPGQAGPTVTTTPRYAPPAAKRPGNEPAGAPAAIGRPQGQPSRPATGTRPQPPGKGAPVAAPGGAPAPALQQPPPTGQAAGQPFLKGTPRPAAVPGAPGAPGVPGQPAPVATPGGSPATPATAAAGPAVTKAAPAGAPVVGKVVTPPPGPARLDELKQARVERVEGNRRIIQEPGARTIVKQDNRVFIQRNETTIIQNNYPAARATRLPSGVTQSVYVRPDGMRVYSEVDGSGRLVRRYGRWNDGRQVVYIDNRRFYRNLAIGVGAGLVAAAAIVALAPPRHALPPQRYIVDYERASYDEIYETLSAPPVERLPRAYSLDEIRYNEPIRARMRRIDLDTVTFEFGSFEITPDQYGKLERIAQAMARTVEANPGEMYLIEGHTDAVGSEEDNLSLSDRRAEAVARVLSEYYSIPMENMVTQGYGEQHLKIQTQEPERANRRVTIRRITPLMGQAGQAGGPQ